MKNIVHKVVEIAGGQTALANMLDIKQQSVWKWLKAGKIPPKKVNVVWRAIGFKIPKRKLNPESHGAA